MAYGRKREMFRIGNCEDGEKRLNPRYQPDSGQLWKGFVAFVLIVAMILFATPVAAIPILNFTSPTEPNGTAISRNWTEVNMTITESNLDTFRFNWNGTNYTFYDDSLVLALNFNNNSAIGESSTLAVDISKFGNNGTIHGASWTQGKFGSALKFDGTDDYVDCGNFLDFSSTNFTIILWIYDNNPSANSAFIAKWGGGSGNREFVFEKGDSKLAWTISDGTSYFSLQGNTTLSANVWYHIAVVNDWDNDEAILYLNGNQDAIDTEWTSSMNSYTTSVKIGTRTLDNYFNGTIDEVRIYNRALTPEEIRMHYLSEFQKYNSTQYRFYNNITNLTDGTYTYYGWANDTAGNTGNTETRTLTVDAVSPYYISNCTTLNESGATYYLTADIIDSSTSHCMNISANNVTLDCQGHPIDGNFSLNGDSSSNKYAIYSNQQNTTIKNCIISNWQIGIYFDTCADNGVIENNTIRDLYGSKGIDAPDASNNPGGASAGIYLKSSYNRIANNTIENLTAGRGGNSLSGSYLAKSGGSGGIATGIYLDLSTNNTLTSNQISNLTGGAGGTGGEWGSGGSGGLSTGIYLKFSSNNNLTSNAISSLIGGSGGIGGTYSSYESSGGAGGIAAGIYLNSSTSNTLTSNQISNLTMGIGGKGSSSGFEGSNGTSAGIWLDESSYDNVITQLTTQGSYKIPNDAELNKVENAPVLYFYDESNLNISNYNVTTEISPILIGGSYETGNPGGAGGIATGISLINVTNSIVGNNTVSGFKGMQGGTGDEDSDGGGPGGVSTGIYLKSSTNNNFTSNKISNLIGGSGGAGGLDNAGGSGGIATGIYLSSSTNNIFASNQMSSLMGGTGGTKGGAGGVACGAAGVAGVSAGIWLDESSYDNVITQLTTQGSYKIPNDAELNKVENAPILYFYDESNLNISNYNVTTEISPILIGGSYETGKPGGSAGISLGISLINVTNSIVENNTVSGFKGMQGGSGGYRYSSFGGGGGTIAGIYLSHSTFNNLTSNSVLNLTGGTGGSGGVWGSGGAGGTAAGIYLSYSTSNNLISNSVLNLTGGTGGSSGMGACTGGSGGIATGIYMASSTNNNFSSNQISNLAGGQGGTGGEGGYGSNGSMGIPAGMWLDTSSYDNVITQLTTQGSYKIPNDAELNKVENAPVLYFYDESNLNISNYNVTTEISPILIGGSYETGNPGGAGGIATGISLINVTNSIVGNNTVSGFKGMPGGPGDVNFGGSGGISTGIYLKFSSNNNLTSNLISDLMGGAGGGGEGYGSSGGSGGTSAGIYLNSSTSNTLTSNQISNLTGGGGGPEEGQGGISAGIYLLLSSNNDIASNSISSLTAGTAGDMISEGSRGISTGIYIESSTSNKVTSNNISSLKGGTDIGGTCGVWIKTDSYNNTITTLQDNAPDQTKLNFVGRAPILYFYQETGLDITGFNVTTNTTPILIGGSLQAGNPGGSGGIATGISLINVTDSIINNNTISGFKGMSGGHGAGGTGGLGGVSTGIYLFHSQNNNLTSNTISNLTGGVGGKGGIFMSGGAGGASTAIYLLSSTSNNLTFNIISNLMGGQGGAAGEYGSPGVAGKPYGLYLTDAQSNNIYNNLFNVTNTAYISGTGTNFWNTIKQLGERVYSLGNEIGGNYWTNPSGTGYSDTCNDTNHDGFCDDYYNLTTGNIDYLPLSDKYEDTTPPVISIINPANGTALPAGTTWTWINISTDENATCRYSTNSSFNFSEGSNFTTTGGLNHSFLYTGLQDGKSYNLYYKCNDSKNINPESVHHYFSVSVSTTTTTTSTSTIPGTTTTTSTSTTTITTTSTISTSTTTTLGTTTTTTISTTTTIIWPCDLPGDYPTCGEVTLEEVVDFINLWSLGQADLEDVVNLINAWAEGPVCELPGDYPPCGEVTLEEVVDFINLWVEGKAELGDVVNLINAWAGS